MNIYCAFWCHNLALSVSHFMSYPSLAKSAQAIVCLLLFVRLSLVIPHSVNDCPVEGWPHGTFRVILGTGNLLGSLLVVPM